MRTITYYASRAGSFIKSPGAISLVKRERKKLKLIPDSPTPENLYASAAMAVDWLLNAQSHSPDGGFPTLSMGKGFGSSYPETSGYILETLINWHCISPSVQLEQSIQKTVNWLLEIQHPDGGWQSGYVDQNKPPVVFNTAQVMRGLITMYKKNNDQVIADSLDKAAQWIVDVQESPGVWARHNYLGHARVYDTYVDAPLMRWGLERKNADVIEAANKNIRWVMKKQQSNGWFADADNTIKHNHQPILHTIAYTVDGLLEFAELSDEEDVFISGKITADILALRMIADKRLPGRFDERWRGAEAAIPTGYAQMVVAWRRIHDRVPQQKTWLQAIDLTCAYLMHMQWKDTDMPHLDGAVSGSYPFWGKYEPFRCPNWAVKYFIDAMMAHPKFPLSHA